MARYLAEDDQLTYSDYLSLKDETFRDLETHLDDRFDLFNALERLTELEVGMSDAVARIQELEDQVEALQALAVES